MSLITSISGIRGTIGGATTEGLNPINIAEFVSGYATFIRSSSPAKSNKVVVGRDARISGSMVHRIVVGTLQGMGLDVVDLGFATTPTTEIAVTAEQADGGIIITASHNPKEWNALKLLNHKGEFLNAAEGEQVLSLSTKRDFTFADVHHLGGVEEKSYTQYHVEEVLKLPYVDVEAVRTKGFRVIIDTINSVGSIAVPPLLDALGVHYKVLNGEPTGDFAHTAEPLPENLTQISDEMRGGDYHVGFAVDPDVDRLAILCEDGTPFGEEYTLVSIADYLLTEHPGSSTVSNLSSSRALRDVTEKHGGKYYATAVGEVNVSTKMKEVDALIGGEGNGGVIYPASHYGRDALVGIALFLTALAKRGQTPSEWRKELPAYFAVKEKIQLSPTINVEQILKTVAEHYQGKAEINTIDGVKLDFPENWIHLRKSNTEPIIRIYAEAKSPQEAEALVHQLMQLVKEITA